MKPLLTKAEACDVLNVSLTTLTKLMYSGDLPFIKEGKMVRFRPEHLEEWAKARTVDVRSR